MSSNQPRIGLTGWKTRLTRAFLALAVSVVLVSPLLAQGVPQYRPAPDAVRKVLDAPETPVLVVSPLNDLALLVNYERYARIADLSQPMLRLAGVRINPATNGPHNPRRHTSITIKSLADGSTEKDIPVTTPPDALLSLPSWSPDGRRFVFTVTTASGIQLWTGDPASGAARQVTGVTLNAAYGAPYTWMAAQSLLCRTVPAGRGASPAPPRVPAGPHIEESSGKPAPVRTYQDLLETPHDAALFVRYENFDTQFRMPDGFVGLPQFDRDAWVAGATYWVDPDVALKFDYSHVRNRSTVVPAPRSINVGLGWWF